MEKKGRGGKTVTVVDGLPNNAAFLKDLCQELKRACGTGGAVADGAIELQGDLRDRVRDCLAEERLRRKGLTYNSWMPKLTVEGYGYVRRRSGKASRPRHRAEREGRYTARLRRKCALHDVPRGVHRRRAADAHGGGDGASCRARSHRRALVLPNPVRSRHDRPCDQPPRGIGTTGSGRHAGAGDHAAAGVDVTLAHTHSRASVEVCRL